MAIKWLVEIERRAITVEGVVQGVGFRPFVRGLATRLRLAGFVLNQAGTVRIEVEGETEGIEEFVKALTDHPPPLARIARIQCERLVPRGERQFEIALSSVVSGGPIFVSPDVATCDACLEEMFDPADRRYCYPFLNCTNCGPRLTIITGAPYDRARTTMAGFPMCPACRSEYEDPTNRRFHAQPTCCPACGPHLLLRDAAGNSVATDDPVAALAAELRAGKIGAIKGLGGYHLACDAQNETAVAELRRRKHRDEKPFAVMVLDLAAAETLCLIDSPERKLLCSPARPIVLLRRRHTGVTAAVAPGNPHLGVMLPYTPLHHLLLRELNVPLVMTSGNRSDEPIAYEDESAIKRLAGIADLFLTHDRPIHVRCDDSVTRIIGVGESPLRRSRGYAPQPIALPFECPRPILAVGGQLKATFALGRGREAFLSHHLGDLDHYDAFRAFEKDVVLYQDLFAIRPQVIAHDLHPDYASTKYANRRATAQNVSHLVPVQHHHAHMASCMAENGLSGPVIGITFDGTGYGTDGAIWGGEFLIGDYRSFRRAAHFRYVGLPGGDQAIREPWRTALAHLKDAGLENAALRARILPDSYRTIEMMLDRQFRTPPSSSAGRLFDAVAALAEIRDRVNYEGQAAVELEWLATGLTPDVNYPFELLPSCESASPRSAIIDTRPLIAAVIEDVNRGVDAPRISRRFQSTLVEIISTVCARIRADGGLRTVVLSGGVFLNALLSGEVNERLTAEGFDVYRHRLVPPNDGGLSLGQLAVASFNV